MNKLKCITLLLLATGLPLCAQNVPGQLAKTVVSSPLTSAVEKATRQALIHTKDALARSIFRAYRQGAEGSGAFSGFVFKTSYQGKEEIFGAIATHGVPLGYNKSGPGIYFTARILVNEKEVDIPAEIVQMSSSIMLDVSLVKFRPEDEKLLTPLTLATQDPELNESLYLVGFGCDNFQLISALPLTENSLFSLRFPMKGESEQWRGLCGSPLLNTANEVVGTMTGATLRGNNPTHYTGYATRNLYLHTLISAYHGEVGKATFPLVLGEHKIVDLNADEFVSKIALKNEDGKTIFYRRIYNKFPYGGVTKLLPQADTLKWRLIMCGGPGIRLWRGCLCWMRAMKRVM